MHPNVVLVRVPSSPFHIDTLRPDLYLSQILSVFSLNGYPTQLMDYGTLQALEDLYPLELRGSAISAAERRSGATHEVAAHSWAGLCKSKFAARRLAQHHHEVWRGWGRQVASHWDCNTFLFKIFTQKDLDASLEVAKELRNIRPRIRLIGLCSPEHRDPSILTAALKYFDCIYLGAPGPGLIDLVSRLNEPRRWSSIPGLAFNDGVRLVITPQAERATPEETPVPSYDPDLYPALSKASKLLLFDVPAQLRDATSQTSDSMTPWRPPGSHPVIELVRDLTLRFGTHAFHFLCDGGTWPMEKLAYELLNRRLDICYSASAPVENISSSVVSALGASGCRVLSFRIESGSQRLIEDFYRRSFTVTQTERAIRISKASNMYTMAHFSYPCPEDDYHTRAETVRLVQRTRPHAAPLIQPDAKAHGESSNLLLSFTPGARDEKRSREEHEGLRQEIEDLDVPTRITPDVALMARLAGFSGRESELHRQLTYQLASGDALGTACLVERFNRAAKSPARRLDFRPFAVEQNIAAN